MSRHSLDVTLDREDPFGEKTSRLPTEADADSYQSFVEATLAEECAFYQLSERLFVVNGWNVGRKVPTVSDF